MSEIARIDQTTGLPARSWMDQLNPEDMLAWVRGRLSGYDPYFPLRDDIETRRELFLHLVKQLSRSDDLAQTLGRVADDLAAEIILEERPDPRVFRETMGLFGEMPTAERVGPLLESIESAVWTTPYRRENQLGLLVLEALSRKPSGTTLDFWTRRLGDPETCEISLAAIQDNHGWEEAVRGLAKELHLFEQHPRKMNLELAWDYLARSSVVPVSLLAQTLYDFTPQKNRELLIRLLGPKVRPHLPRSSNRPRVPSVGKATIAKALQSMLPTTLGKNRPKAEATAITSLGRRKFGPGSLKRVRSERREAA